MRFQKLLILFVVIGLSLTLAFEETALSAPASSQPNDSDAHARADQFFRKSRIFIAADAPMLAEAAGADNSNADPLLELLRQKQSELDAQQRGIGKVAAPEPKAPAEPKVTQPAKTAEPVAASSANASAENDLIEILRRKQDELNRQGHESQVAPQPVQPKARVEQPLPSKRNVAAPESVAAQPAIAPKAHDQLLDLLHQKEAELNAAEPIGQQPAVAPQPVTPQPATSVEPKARVEKVSPPKHNAKVPEPKIAGQPAVSSNAEALLMETLREKQSELDAKEKVVKTEEAPVVQSGHPEVADKRIRDIEAEIKAKEEAFKKSAAAKKQGTMKAANANNAVNQSPILAPGSKEARLDELLRKYKADEITPHQYHEERAKIIAEP
jgi:hypothetical protein